MKRTVFYLLLAVLLGASGAGAEEFFPIGAWFPFSEVPEGVNRYNNLIQAEVDTILQQVKNAGFNVVHAPHHLRGYQTPALNEKLLNAAQGKGLKVQLYAWQQPVGSDSVWKKDTYWCRTVDMTAYNTNIQNSLALKQPYGDGCFKYHRFYLKTDDNTTSEVVAVIQVWDGGVKRDSRDIPGTDFDQPNEWEEFELTYYINSAKTVTYKVQYTGAANLWVDKVRAYGKEDYPYRLLDGDYDTQFETIIDSYDGYPAMWRFYLADEPWWDVTNESIRYMGDFLEARGKSWQAANNYYADPTWLNKFVRETQPAELLVDPYPFHVGGDRQSELNTLSGWLNNSKAAAADIPLWVAVQAHSWGDNLRNPTPAEIRVQVNMALAYGAKGIYYFMYAPYPASNCIGLVDGEIPGNRNDKWSEVQAINTRLDSLDDVLLQLTSDQTGLFQGSPVGFVSNITGGDYIHVGTFTHATDPAGYLMLVNRKCESTDTQTVAVTLNASGLEGSGYSYLVKDMYSKQTWVTAPESSPSFTVSLAPGEGKLFWVKQ